MSWTDTAFIQRMLNDGELTQGLALYKRRPAIFPYLWIPALDEDPDAPAQIYIVTEGDVSYVPQNYKGTICVEGMRDIRIYGTKMDGAAVVDQKADRVATLFRSDKLQDGEVMFPNQPINLIDSMAYGPMAAATEGTFIGKRVRVRFRVQELSN